MQIPHLALLFIALVVCSASAPPAAPAARDTYVYRICNVYNDEMRGAAGIACVPLRRADDRRTRAHSDSTRRI